jgi:hypothetical protein
VEIRGIFKKMDGVIDAYAFGDTSVVKVLMKSTDGLKEDAVKKAVNNDDFQVKKFTKLKA